MDSILTSIKKLLGIVPEYTHFDEDIVIHVNTALSTLWQLGVGKNALSIANSDSKWDELTDDLALQNLCKNYVYLKVKMLFDPPLASSAIESNNRLISELESRINMMAETDNKKAY